jgi:hypothetical protein
MVKRCALCGTKENVFVWPSDVDIANKWTAFVATCNAKITIRKTSGICRNHFLDDDFKNYAKWELLKNNKSSR